MYLNKKLFFLLLFFYSFLFSQNQTVGVFQYNEGIYDAYTLFSPSRDTYLIDNCGQLIHTWSSNYQTGGSIYLLEDGSLLRTTKINEYNVFDGGGIGGGVEKLDWDGNVIWSYPYNSETYHQHHDIEPLPNGNILILGWELKTEEEAINKGRDPLLLEDGELWPEHIVEIDPNSDGGNIVWEWHLWDHLIQDFDSSLVNYGVVSEHPELLNINYMGPGQNSAGGKADWIHANSIDYNEELDQIIISSRALSEFWIIDHSTTTEEAASSSGGNSGMGGDILYRWGNPKAYDRGTVNDRVLFGQHHVEWIDKQLPGEDNIILFNNGRNRPEGNYSSIDELSLPVNGYNYEIESENPYGPFELVWTYVASNPYDFFADHVSGCQRLPNGNTLICSGPDGIFYEVDDMSNILWEYKNPVYGNITLNQGDTPPVGPFGQVIASNSVFRCEKFNAEFAGFEGHELIAGLPIEGPPYIYPTLCVETSLEESDNLSKKLIKRVDLLGRERANKKGLFIELYNDGKVQKTYQIR